MLASALLAVSMPLHNNRLTSSFSTWLDLPFGSPAVNQLGTALVRRRAQSAHRGSSPSQMVSTTSVFACSKSEAEAGIRSNIQPERSCSIAP
jgi:hypothetical protein